MDYIERLKSAIAKSKAAGFETEANALEVACFGIAYTTSSELLGEHRLAIQRFLKATRGALPRSIKARLKECLAETRRV
jgi:hypothetical protein